MLQELLDILFWSIGLLFIVYVGAAIMARLGWVIL